MKIGEEQDYSLYNENGNPRKILQNFKDAKVGDLIWDMKPHRLSKLWE